MKILFRRWPIALSWALAVVFLAAGSIKWADPAGFAEGLASFRLVPLFAVNGLALSVPILEIGTGLLLLPGPTRRRGALLAVFLSLSFLMFFLSAFLRGIEVKCSCFGHWNFLAVSTAEGVVRAAVLAILCAGLYFRLSSGKGSESPADK